MRPFKKIATFTDHYPYIGPTIWILCIQYYITQAVVAMAWTTHFSLLSNTISDLGNTACRIYAGRQVCSPLHGLMNASFILLGVTMASGSLFIYQEFRKSAGTRIGFSFMAIAGFGALLVGMFPENSVMSLHLLGAGLTFLIGNIGIVVLSYALSIPKSLRYYTFLSGLVSLVALLFFVFGRYGVFGEGGLERIVAYPQTMWLIVFGIYISRSHYINRNLKK